MATPTASTPRLVQLPAALRNLAELAALLERIERGERAPDPQQYRTLIERIAAELQARPHDQSLDELLSCFPAAAEVYENLNYAWAGLCRAPLDASAQSEQEVRALLKHAARPDPAR